MSKTLCALPWTHLASNPDGSIMPCCYYYRYKKDFGNIDETDFKELYNGPLFNELRQKLMNGEKPEECSKCFGREALGRGSMRTRYNNTDWGKETLKEIPTITNEDGSLNKIKIKYWDVRFSNICNMACIMCGSDFSSKWAAELGENKQSKLLNNFEKSKTYQFIDDNIQDVEEIYFAGGEPLIMDEHYYIMDKLVELGKTDVNIRYNTNLLKLEHKGKNVLDYWKNWKGELDIAPSIDAIGPRAEYARYGTDWKRVDSNLKTLLDLGFNVRPLVAVGIHNLLHLQSLYQYFMALGIKDVGFNMIDNDNYNILYAPQDLKDDALTVYNEAINNLGDTNGIKIATVEIKTRLEQKADSSRSTFISAIKKIDQRRGTDFFNAFPELIKYYYGAGRDD